MYRDISNDNNSCVAIYKIFSEVEQSIRQLSQSDFDLTHLSILANGYHRHENIIGYYNTGEQIRFWGQQGASGVDYGVSCQVQLFSGFRALGLLLLAAPWQVFSYNSWRSGRSVSSR